jgi:hypothetical protein
MVVRVPAERSAPDGLFFRLRPFSASRRQGVHAFFMSGAMRAVARQAQENA